MHMGQFVNRLESAAFLSTTEAEIIETRFGKITVNKDNPICFSRGLLGMPDRYNFFLTEFPDTKLRQFKLLQCLDDYGLSFITLPLDLSNSIIASEDIVSASRELGIALENLGLLLIVSVHRAPGKVTLSVNARAPLFIDTASRNAAQHVFQSDKYKVQHIFTT